MLVFGALIQLVATGAASAAAGDKKNVITFGTQTSGPTKPDGRGYYSFAATPGGRILDHVAILNYSQKPTTLILRGVDVINTPQGGLAGQPVNQTPRDVGAWIALPSSELSVSLGPRSDLIVPFLIEVPKNATPGDHVGAVTATLQSFVISKSGQRVRLLQTVGSRIFLRVSGPLHPAFAVENMRVRYSGTWNPIGTGHAVLTYTVHNTGNVALGGRQTVSVTGLFGSKRVARHVADIQLLLPGFSVKETVPVSDIIPEIRDTGHVSISPLYIPGSVQPATGPYKGSLSFWAIPWTLLAIIVVLLAGAGWLIRRWRKRKSPEPGGGRPGRSTGPAVKTAGDSGGRDPVPSQPSEPTQSPEPTPVASKQASKGQEEVA